MRDDLPTGFDPATDIRLDAATLRALAHPLRVRLLGRLRQHGPATASQLGARLGESSGATSYHLRQLARHGLVAEEPDRGTARERWWRAVHRSTVFDLELDDETRTVGAEYLRAVAISSSERLLTHAARLGLSPTDPFDDASTLSDWHFAFTPSEAEQLKRELFEVMVRHRDKAAGGPREATFVAQLQLFAAPVEDGSDQPSAS